MSHANARLTFFGRCLLVQRVRFDRRPVAHVASELGVSRQCAHRWVARFDAEGWDGLHDRSSRPRSCPRRTSELMETRVLAARAELRCGPVGIALVTGVPARTVSRILRRHGVAALADCDPISGAPIRAVRVSERRYERDRPGELVHLDVKKLGRIRDGGGWRALGRETAPRSHGQKTQRIGYDYVHAAVDDHSRLAYAEVLPDEKGATCAGFLLRAASHFAAHGVDRIERVITDNAMNYTLSNDFATALDAIGATHKTIKPYRPWQNGKVERLNRTLAIEWAYRRAYLDNDERTAALAGWLEYYNTGRPHSALNGQPPISRLSPTS